MFSNSFIIRIYTQCFTTVLLSGYILNVFQQFYYQDICFPTVLLSGYILNVLLKPMKG